MTAFHLERPFVQIHLIHVVFVSAPVKMKGIYLTFCTSNSFDSQMKIEVQS